MKETTLKSKVYALMKEFLAGNDGMRAKVLKNAICERMPDQKTHSIGAVMSLLAAEHSEKFEKMTERGAGVFYSLRSNFSPEERADERQNTADGEKRYYKPFAEFLESDDMKECTKAIEVGGNIFGDKWGTPDVIGVFRPHDGDIVRFPDEIVSAEIKCDNMNDMYAFGQACAYRLFSHKTYLVIPESRKKNGRLQSLCKIFGVGLVSFKDKAKPDPSIFTCELPAQKYAPDMFSVNERIPEKVLDDLYNRQTRKKRK